MIRDALIWGLAAPALAALALAWAAGREAVGLRARLAALAPAAALFVACAGLVGWPALPPREALHLLPWLLLLPLASARPWFLALAAVALSAALAYPLWPRDPGAVALALAPVWALGPALVFAQARAIRRAGPDAYPALRLAWAWIPILAAAAVVLGLAHSAKLAQLAGALATAGGAIFLLGWRRRGRAHAAALAGLALGHLGLVAQARLYAWPELGLAPALGLLLAPGAALLWATARGGATATATAPPGGAGSPGPEPSSPTGTGSGRG